MRLVSVSFQDCAEKVFPIASAFILSPHELIDRGESICNHLGHTGRQFVRIDYRKEVVEFMVN